MNILVLAPYVPFPLSYGGAIRTYHLIRQLSQQHTIHLLAYRGEGLVVDPCGLDGYCKTVTVLPWNMNDKRRQQARSLLSTRSCQWRRHCGPAMQEALDRVICEQRIQIVLVEFPQMAGFRFPDGVKVVLDEHNVEFRLLERMAQSGGLMRRIYNRLEAYKFRREELGAAQRADLTLVTSEYDGNILRQHVPGLRVANIANGVNCNYFARPERPREPDTAVFIGATQYFPNEDGMLFFLRDIHERIRAERPSFRLAVVGGKPPSSLKAYRSTHVDITGYVDDVRPYLWDASVFVVPLRMGSGTRFKVVEAMAAGIPVVATRLGAEGIPATDGKELLLADKPEDFAQAVIRVLTDPELAGSLAREGLALVKQNFDWSIIGNALNKALFPNEERNASRGKQVQPQNLT